MSNPYAPPESTPAPVPTDGLTAMERDRTLHRVHEARVRILGIAFMVQGGLRVLTLLAMAFALVADADYMENDWLGASIGAAFYAVTGALSLVGGWALHQLKPWGRGFGFVMFLLSLISIPVGTLLSIWGAILLLTSKGRRVFSPDYAAVRAATPHLRWSPQPAAFIGAALLGAVVLASCAGLLLLGV